MITPEEKAARRDTRLIRRYIAPPPLGMNDEFGRARIRGIGAEVALIIDQIEDAGDPAAVRREWDLPWGAIDAARTYYRRNTNAINARRQEFRDSD